MLNIDIGKNNSYVRNRNSTKNIGLDQVNSYFSS